MASNVGAALRGSVLAGCVLAALSTTTITQQSSSAWGTLDNGKTVDRGTHTSHTTDQLPDGVVEPDLELEGRFGGGGLDFRGGFGSRRRPSHPSRPDVGQDPSLQAPSFGSPGGTSVGQDPSLSAPSFGSPDRTSAGQDPSQQAPSAVDVQDAFNRFPGQYPGFGVHRGFYQPRPSAGLPQPVRGGCGQPWPSVRAGYNPLWQPSPAGSAPPSDVPAVDGAGAGEPGGAAVPSFGQPGNPLHPDISSLVNQMTAEAFQNVARSFQQDVPRGGAGIGGANGYVPHGSGDSTAQPRVQTQHASVDSRSIQRTWPLPGFDSTRGGAQQPDQPVVQEQHASVESRSFQRPIQTPARFPQFPATGSSLYPTNELTNKFIRYPTNQVPLRQPYFSPSQEQQRAGHHIWFPNL